MNNNLYVCNGFDFYNNATYNVGIWEVKYNRGTFVAIQKEDGKVNLSSDKIIIPTFGAITNFFTIVDYNDGSYDVYVKNPPYYCYRLELYKIKDNKK